MNTRPKPAEYGRWWNTNSEDEQWYRQIFKLRERAHLAFLDWYSGLVKQGEPALSILEVGCGRAYPYARIFKAMDYNGTDISEKEITYCQETYGTERFFVSDVISHVPTRTYDVVFSHAVIDHVYDIPAFLLQLAKLSRGWLYVSGYWGWFPTLTEHSYRWDQRVTCYYNQISPRSAKASLELAGCRDVQVFPVYVGNQADHIDFETVITARGLAK